jgi:hypothetical protein
VKTNTVKKTVLLLCFGAFCWNAYFDLLQESKNTLALFKTFYGLTDGQKKELLFRDTWLLIDKISRIIPEDSRIFFRTDDFCEMFYCAYGLFPRKLYLPDNSELHYLPSRDNLALDWEWLARKHISWVVVRTSDHLIRVMKIADGKILQEIHFPG